MKVSANLVNLKKLLQKAAGFQRMMFASYLSILSPYSSHAKKKFTRGERD